MKKKKKVRYSNTSLIRYCSQEPTKSRVMSTLKRYKWDILMDSYPAEDGQTHHLNKNVSA